MPQDTEETPLEKSRSNSGDTDLMARITKEYEADIRRNPADERTAYAALLKKTEFFLDPANKAGAIFYSMKFLDSEKKLNPERRHELLKDFFSSAGHEIKNIEAMTERLTASRHLFEGENPSTGMKWEDLAIQKIFDKSYNMAYIDVNKKPADAAVIVLNLLTVYDPKLRKNPQPNDEIVVGTILAHANNYLNSAVKDNPQAAHDALEGYIDQLAKLKPSSGALLALYDELDQKTLRTGTPLRESVARTLDTKISDFSAMPPDRATGRLFDMLKEDGRDENGALLFLRPEEKKYIFNYAMDRLREVEVNMGPTAALEVAKQSRYLGMSREIREALDQRIEDLTARTPPAPPKPQEESALAIPEAPLAANTTRPAAIKPFGV